MPRGRPRKNSAAESNLPKPDSNLSDSGNDTPPVSENPEPVLTGQDKAIAESRKLLDVPLAPGQAYYESPEGFIVIDEASRGRVMCRLANNRKGMWINPKR